MAVKRQMMKAVGDAAVRHSIALRLASGAQLVFQRRATSIAGWVAAGRRDDLAGWRSLLGPIVRILALTLLASMAYRVLRALPWLMWLLVAAWLRAAWRATRRTEDAQDPLADGSPTPDITAVLTLLHVVLDGTDRVHLSAVLAHLQEQGYAAGWKVADLRARLESLGVPTQPKVKVGRTPTRGILRADLDHHFPGWDTTTSTSR